MRGIGVVVCTECKGICYATKKPIEEGEQVTADKVNPKPKDTGKFICPACGNEKFWAGLEQNIPEDLKK